MSKQVAKVRCRTPYTPRVRVSQSCPGGRTRQSAKDECDINKIVARYQVTGELPPAMRVPSFADVSEIGDFQTCVDRVQAARDYFYSLPSKVRLEFNNSPVMLLDAIADPSQRSRLVELGLWPKADSEGQSKGEAPSVAAATPPSVSK